MKKIEIVDKDLNQFIYYKSDFDADFFIEQLMLKGELGEPEEVQIKITTVSRAKVLGTEAVQKEVMECTAKLLSSWDGRKTLGGKKPPVHADISLEIDGVLQGKIGVTPTATVGTWRLYGKLDNKLYFQDSAGIEHEVAFGLL